MTSQHHEAHPDFSTENYTYVTALDTQNAKSFELVQEYSNCNGFAMPENVTQCAHCGAHIRFAAIMVHTPTNAAVAIGETCLSNRFSLSAPDFEALRMAAKAQAEQTKLVGKLESFLREHDDFRALLNEYAGNNEFVLDVLRKLERYGELTENQVAAVRKCVARDAEFAARRKEEAKTAKPAPEGRVTFEGVILSTRVQEGYMGKAQHKMLVAADAGFKVWVSVPSSLEASKGTRIALTATLSPTEKDPAFAIGRNPKLQERSST